MNKKNLIIYLIFLVMIVVYPYKVHAEECSQTELNKLKAYANATEIKYYYTKEYIQYEGKIEDLDVHNLFNISINNLSNNIFAMLNNTNTVYAYNDLLEVQNTITKGPFLGGTKYVFNFYSNINDACNAKLLITKSITLPSFNHYSLDPLCKGIENYRLCNMWNVSNITMEEFVKKVTEYKNSLKDDDSNQNLLPQNKWDVMMDWLINNYNIILISIIVIGISIIVIIKINEKRKNVL